MSTQIELVEAIGKAQAEAVALLKDAQNKQQNYRYLSSETMIQESKRILLENGLVLIPIQTEIDRDGTPVVAKRVFELVHIPSAEAMTLTSALPIEPHKGRPWDKAGAGSLTTSLSYFLRDLLLIPRVTDEEDIDFEPIRMPTRTTRNGDRQERSRDGREASRKEEPARERRPEREKEAVREPAEREKEAEPAEREPARREPRAHNEDAPWVVNVEQPELMELTTQDLEDRKHTKPSDIEELLLYGDKLKLTTAEMSQHLGLAADGVELILGLLDACDDGSAKDVRTSADADTIQAVVKDLGVPNDYLVDQVRDLKIKRDAATNEQAVDLVLRLVAYCWGSPKTVADVGEKYLESALARETEGVAA